MNNYPKKTDWWWVRIDGMPTIVRVMYQCQELWSEDQPWREVRMFLPWGDGDIEFGFMDKATGDVLSPSGRPANKHFEWVRPVADEMPHAIYHPDAIAALAGA